MARQSSGQTAIAHNLLELLPLALLLPVLASHRVISLSNRQALLPLVLPLPVLASHRVISLNNLLV